MKRRQQGFTVIEVMLFLAISTALLLVAIFTSTTLANQTRFSDTINSYTSTLQRQFEEVASGVNVRTAVAGVSCSAGIVRPGEDSCLLIGKVISFSYDSPDGFIRYIRVPATPVADVGDVYSQLSAVGPSVAVLSTAEEGSTLQWGAVIQEASRTTGGVGGANNKASSTRGLIRAVAFVRGPNTSTVVPYYFFFSGNDTAANVQTGLRQAIANSALTARTHAAICIINPSNGITRPVAIELGMGTGSAGIDTNFQPKKGPTEICS